MDLSIHHREQAAMFRQRGEGAAAARHAEQAEWFARWEQDPGFWRKPYRWLKTGVGASSRWSLVGPDGEMATVARLAQWRADAWFEGKITWSVVSSAEHGKRMVERWLYPNLEGKLGWFSESNRIVAASDYTQALTDWRRNQTNNERLEVIAERLAMLAGAAP